MKKTKLESILSILETNFISWKVLKFQNGSFEYI